MILVQHLLSSIWQPRREGRQDAGNGEAWLLDIDLLHHRPDLRRGDAGSVHEGGVVGGEEVVDCIHSSKGIVSLGSVGAVAILVGVPTAELRIDGRTVVAGLAQFEAQEACGPGFGGQATCHPIADLAVIVRETLTNRRTGIPILQPGCYPQLFPARGIEGRLQAVAADGLSRKTPVRW